MWGGAHGHSKYRSHSRGKPEGAARGGKLREADVPECGFAQAEMGEAECQVDVGGEFGEEPGTVPVRGCELDDGFELQRLVLAVDGVALRAAVLEEFLAGAGLMSVMCSIPVWGGPTRSVRLEHGPRRGRGESNSAHRSRGIRDRDSSRRDSGFVLARRVRAQSGKYAAIKRVEPTTSSSRPKSRRKRLNSRPECLCDLVRSAIPLFETRTPKRRPTMA